MASIGRTAGLISATESTQFILQLRETTWYSYARRGKGRIGRTAGLIGAPESTQFVLHNAQTLVELVDLLGKLDLFAL